MKKKILFLLTILLLPIIVSAEDAGLRNELYNKLGQEGRLKITSINSLGENYLANTPETAFVDDGEQRADNFEQVVASYIYNLPEVKELFRQYSDENPAISVYCKGYRNCGIYVSYSSDASGSVPAQSTDEYPNPKMKHYDIEMTIASTLDNTAYSWIKKNILPPSGKQFRTYYLYDLAYINQMYNQNSGVSDFTTQLSASPATIARNFPEINDLLNNNPNYDIKFGKPSEAGSTWNSVSYTKTADFVAYYKNTAYLTTTLEFKVAPVLFVEDTTADNKLIEAAKERINSYINNKDLQVVINDVTARFSDDQLNAIRTDLTTFLLATKGTEAPENFRVYSLKIGATESPNNFYIIKAPKEYIKDLEIQAIEKSTGLRFTSNSVGVPIDSSLEVLDVTNDYIKKNNTVEKAYDINLYSETKGTFVKSVVGGVKIYIPVNKDYTKGENSLVYLDDKGKVQEKIEFQMETINNQKYLTFTTTHFSVYAIVDKDGNPNTVDAIGIILTVCILMLVALIIVRIVKPKKYQS